MAAWGRQASRFSPSRIGGAPPFCLIHRRGLAGDHGHGPPKVNFWQDPLHPSRWKEEHFVIVSLAGWGAVFYGGYKFFTRGKKEKRDEAFLSPLLTIVKHVIPNKLAASLKQSTQVALRRQTQISKETNSDEPTECHTQAMTYSKSTSQNSSYRDTICDNTHSCNIQIQHDKYKDETASKAIYPEGYVYNMKPSSKGRCCLFAGGAILEQLRNDKDVLQGRGRRGVGFQTLEVD
ncbi:hypothetical protein Cgig2_018939 [Carnegiea gigantea]|uniref:Uncharacterized protein n=1 Tax=Carnegiea gigantea TaxID=171969 RepID=A0A9Q1GTS5_9CARY|nr:hypothetical protein Cgig2_018939 [Carnegiea gigantea]